MESSRRPLELLSIGMETLCQEPTEEYEDLIRGGAGLKYMGMYFNPEI